MSRGLPPRWLHTCGSSRGNNVGVLKGSLLSQNDTWSTVYNTT
jgi:hypothetical protein